MSNTFFQGGENCFRGALPPCALGYGPDKHHQYGKRTSTRTSRMHLRGLGYPYVRFTIKGRLR